MFHAAIVWEENSFVYSATFATVVRAAHLLQYNSEEWSHCNPRSVSRKNWVNKTVCWQDGLKSCRVAEEEHKEGLLNDKIKKI